MEGVEILLMSNMNVPGKVLACLVLFTKHNCGATRLIALFGDISKNELELFSERP